MIDSGSKRNKIDDTFRRMFNYEWGTQFDIDATLASTSDREFIRMFGVARAARILRNRKNFTKRKKESLQPLSFFVPVSTSKPSELLPQTVDPKTNEDGTCKSTAKVVSLTTQTASNIDDVLKQLAGPSKTSTVKKTSDDWESFKESDKQLQDELEKQAQGKGAYLVKKDFLLRVDNRKFEIEKEGREKERVQKMAQG